MDNKCLTFKQFLKKNWLIFVCLGIFPVIVLVTFVVVMKFGKCDITDLGSMLGGLLAYCGTIFLGTITVYQVERQRQENFIMLEEQNYQANKGTMQFFVEEVNNKTIFVVKNFGKSEIYNGSIIFDKEWFDELETFGDIPKIVKDSFQKILSQKIYLAPNQEIRLLLYYSGMNPKYYNFLTNKNCKGKLSYDTLGKNVEIEFDYSFHAVLTSNDGLNR